MSSSRWLNIQNLKRDLRFLAEEIALLKSCIVGDHRNGDSWMGGVGQKKLIKLKELFTQMCALRALHRGRRHGRSITTIPAYLMQKYTPVDERPGGSTEDLVLC